MRWRGERGERPSFFGAGDWPPASGPGDAASPAPVVPEAPSAGLKSSARASEATAAAPPGASRPAAGAAASSAFLRPARGSRTTKFPASFRRMRTTSWSCACVRNLLNLLNPSPASSKLRSRSSMRRLRSESLVQPLSGLISGNALRRSAYASASGSVPAVPFSGAASRTVSASASPRPAGVRLRSRRLESAASLRTLARCGGDAPGGNTSCWPLSSLRRRRRPREAASARNLLNLLNPCFDSSKRGLISSITCLSRSERITSPRSTIFFDASLTRFQGSTDLPLSPTDAFWSPVIDEYE